MHWRKLRKSGVTWRSLRVLVGLVVCPALLGSIAGCGPSRPDPLAVVKDGGDRDGDDRPRPQAAQKPAPPKADVKGQPDLPNPAAAANDQPVAGPTGTAPFDLSFLPVDTELVLVAQCGDIIRSPLVQAVTGGRVAALDPLVEGFGTRFADVASLRIGIRNLSDLPVPTAADLAGGLGSVSLRDIALNPDVSSTIVIQTRDRVDETPLRTHGDEVRVGDKRYFRLRSNTFQSTCACIHGLRTLIISDEPTILSIVESKGPPPQPKATFSFAREADLVIALAPHAPSQLERWLPSLGLFESPDSARPEGDTTSEVPPAAAGGQRGDNPTPAASDVPEPQRPVEAVDGPAATDAGIVETQTAGADPPPAIPAHVTGAALMINLEHGVAVNVSLNCDSPQSAEAAEAELRQFAAQLQAAAEEHASDLNGGIRQLADALSTTRLQTVVALMTAVTPDRQTDVLALPALVLGSAGATGDNSSAGAAAPRAGEPAGAFAEQILLEGVPPLASGQPLPGMELRGLARWQPTPPGSDGPRQLELGVVAFGGPAATAVAAGHFQLQEAEVNRLTPLKWVGTSPAYDALGLNPIDGLVPVRRESGASIHPKNGVLAVFTLVPPAEPAAHLRRVHGQFVMRYYTVSNEIVIENLREAIRTRAASQELTQAGVELELSQLNDIQTLEVLAPDAANLGAVLLLQADGTPVDGVNSHSTRSQGQVLHTLSTGGMLPENVGLSITLNSELAEVEVPFEFANLPIPDVGALSDLERAMLVWTEAESDSGLPEGLLVEAQARWDAPEAAAGLFTSAPAADGPDKPRRRYVLSDGGDDDRRQEVGRGRPGFRSERPLRVLVDLTGPLAEQADALGAAQVTSIETDFRTELNFEGAYFHHEDATGGPVAVSSSSRPAGDGPPGGMRIAFHFTPPLEPIHELARFNGSVRLRISQNRTQTLIPNLHERVGRRLTNRELTKLGIAVVARIDENQVLVRVLEGADEQISEIIAVDMFGDPVPGVVVTREESAQRAAVRQVHRLTFASGVPTGLGLRVVANSSVQTVDVPFRFTRLPVPPAPGLPGL
jgi:hypothetical protein